MPCVAECQLPAAKIQNTYKEGAERQLRIVICQHIVYILCYLLRAVRMCHCTAEKRDNLCHEECRRHAFVRNIANAEDELAILQYVVVQVSASFSGRAHYSLQVNISNMQSSRFQNGFLNAGCHLQFTLD